MELGHERQGDGVKRRAIESRRQMQSLIKKGGILINVSEDDFSGRQAEDVRQKIDLVLNELSALNPQLDREFDLQSESLSIPCQQIQKAYRKGLEATFIQELYTKRILKPEELTFEQIKGVDANKLQDILPEQEIVPKYRIVFPKIINMTKSILEPPKLSAEQIKRIDAINLEDKHYVEEEIVGYTLDFFKNINIAKRFRVDPATALELGMLSYKNSPREHLKLRAQFYDLDPQIITNALYRVNPERTLLEERARLRT
jgi:hypothetical protein